MLFEHGLLLRRHHMRKPSSVVMRWDQILRIFEQGVWTPRYVVLSRQGKEVIFSSVYEQLETLIAQVRQHVETQS